MIGFVIPFIQGFYLSFCVIIAAAKKDKDETIYELADLCYHAMVLMADAGISVEDVTKELAKRHVVDHKVKQEYMR